MDSFGQDEVSIVVEGEGFDLAMSVQIVVYVLAALYHQDFLSVDYLGLYVDLRMRAQGDFLLTTFYLRHKVVLLLAVEGDVGDF